MSDCIDVHELYPTGGAPVCVRGTYACPVVHLGDVAREVEQRLERERDLPFGHRPSGDFEGCVE